MTTATLARIWPALATVAAFIIALVGLLASNGYIDPAVHKSDMLVVNRHITEIDDLLKENRTEHMEMRTDIRSMMTSLGRIEGRLSIEHK